MQIRWTIGWWKDLRKREGFHVFRREMKIAKDSNGEKKELKNNYQRKRKEKNYMVFKTELKLIKDIDIFEFVSEALKLLPKYFWTIPSSTSGKYHPIDEFKEGGLVLHTKKVVKLCKEYAKMDNLSNKETDILIASAILHDGFKCGYEGRERMKDGKFGTDELHPLYPLVVFSALFNKCNCVKEITKTIAQHYGRYSKFLYESTKLGRLLHVADYTASRRFISIDLEE